MKSINQQVWRGENISRLVLGTAQLGFSYGIANVTGRPSATGSERIVKTALSLGVNFFDTAQTYGESEQVLGRILKDSGDAWANVITKISLDEMPGADSTRAHITASTKNLGKAPWGVMLHKPSDWASHSEILERIIPLLKREGVLKHFGVSVYTPSEVLSAISSPIVDILQVPANLLDGRMAGEGVFLEAQRHGKLCFIRSIYLQGLLTLTAEQVRKKLPKAAPFVSRFQALADEWGMPLKIAAFRYALTLGCPLVIGADSPGHIEETAKFVKLGPLDELKLREVQLIQAEIPEEIINPSLWPR